MLIKNKLIIKPYIFFSIGFFYYLIVPFLSFILIPDFYEFTPLEAALPYIDLSFFNSYYFTDLFFIYISFLIGFYLSNKIKLSHPKAFFNTMTSDKKFVKLYIGMTSFILLYLSMIFMLDGGKFFNGYQDFNIKILGQISTLTILTLFMYLYTTIENYRKILLLLLFIEFTILLSLGSRNVVMNGAISIALLLMYNNLKIIKSLKFYYVMLIFLTLILFIGLWRTGYEYKVGTFVGIFLSEPMFVLSSASVYLSDIGRDTFNVPGGLIAGILNFVPTFILDNKVEIIKSIVGYKYDCSPFGASSIFMTLYSNFGMMYIFYIVFIGFFYGIIYRLSLESNFYRTVYFIIAPLLMFQFYNQFLFSLLKLLFWNALIVPFIIIFLYQKIANEHNN